VLEAVLNGASVALPARGRLTADSGYANSSIAFDDRPNGS